MQGDGAIEKPAMEKRLAVHAGQAVYTRFMLWLYDPIVFGYNFPVLWRCRRARLLQLYDEHVGIRHLDIGVGSGYLIDKCRFPSASPEIVLMDLNPNSLRFAARRLRRYSPVTHRANVLEPWCLPDQQFDSIAMFNLLHCIPGTLREKAIVFEFAERALTPGGWVFGATILGADADHTKRSRRTLVRFNRQKVFCNIDDQASDLESGLSSKFASYAISVEGVVALFAARKDGRSDQLHGENDVAYTRS